MPTTPAVIGIDLDNTIVDYSDLFIRLLEELLDVDASNVLGKDGVRSAARDLPDGERKWQRLQAVAYGERMAEAHLVDGVLPFVIACRDRSIPVRIVSHKTHYAAADPQGMDLRDAARRWLAASGILEAGDLRQEDIFFEDTRPAKVKRIAALGCSHFIDDLEDVFAEPGFPSGTVGLLFDPDGTYANGHPSLAVCRSWQEITKRVFCDGG